jgi:hypothetical protein
VAWLFVGFFVFLGLVFLGLWGKSWFGHQLSFDNLLGVGSFWGFCKKEGSGGWFLFVVILASLILCLRVQGSVCSLGGMLRLLL